MPAEIGEHHPVLLRRKPAAWAWPTISLYRLPVVVIRVAWAG